MKKILPLILLSFILLLAAFMRLYRISDYMVFLGDEGRDALIAKGILEGQFTLLGPRASAGDFFLGPIYYYMIAPWLWLFKLDPVGPAVMVALFSVATTFLIYWVGKRWFNEQAGLFAAALYAVSPLVITYSHSSWNPNVLPFFSLLIIYMLFKSIATARPWKYFLVTGFLLGIAMQLHYLALFLAVIVAIYIFFAEWHLNEKIKLVETIKHYLLVLGGFILGFSPFLVFEIRHEFLNTRTIFGFIFSDTLQKGYETQANFFMTIADIFFRVFGRLIYNFPSSTHPSYEQLSPIVLQLWGALIVILAIAALIWLFFYKNKFVVLLVYLWLFIGVLLFGLYKKEIHDYYLAFLFPLPFLIIGYFLSQIYQLYAEKKTHFIGITLSLILFIALFAYNLMGNPFQYAPNKQKDQVRIIAESVIKQTGDKPYNFAMISPGNSDHAYRYYLDVLGHKPVVIENPTNDPARKSVTEQLLVVCEDVQCKPLGHPLFDVAAFGRAAIVDDWDVLVVKVYKLIHYTERTE